MRNIAFVGGLAGAMTSQTLPKPTSHCLRTCRIASPCRTTNGRTAAAMAVPPTPGIDGLEGSEREVQAGNRRVGEPLAKRRAASRLRGVLLTRSEGVGERSEERTG